MAKTFRKMLLLELKSLQVIVADVVDEFSTQIRSNDRWCRCGTTPVCETNTMGASLNRPEGKLIV